VWCAVYETLFAEKGITVNKNGGITVGSQEQLLLLLEDLGS
jgi:hypothetical protein